MAGEKKAGRYFTVGDQSFAPGDSVPKEVADLVDNPRVWDENADVRTPSQVREDELAAEAAKAAKAADKK